MKIIERAASAVKTSNLRSEPDTTYSDSDVIGAMGLGARNPAILNDGCDSFGDAIDRRGAPLAMALLRLFAGDNHAAGNIVQILAGMAVGKAWHADRTELARYEATEMAQKVLAWFRNSACEPCGGIGFMKIDGAPILSAHACRTCGGSSKRPFDSEFAMDRLPLARWLVNEVEREMGKAGPAAMKALAPTLEF